MDEFYVISGLGINKSKTLLSIFGSNLEKSKLVKIVGLKWCSDFTLLGIDFDQSLVRMHGNFENALEKCKKSGEELEI